MWARLINAALGVWLMAAPAVLGYDGVASTNHRIVGPIVAAFAIIAIWEVTRALRWINAALGAWLVVAPLVLGYPALDVLINSLVVGLLIVTMATVRGKLTQQFGGGWSALWRSDDRAHS